MHWTTYVKLLVLCLNMYFSGNYAMVIRCKMIIKLQIGHVLYLCELLYIMCSIFLCLVGENSGEKDGSYVDAGSNFQNNSSSFLCYKPMLFLFTA